MKARDEFINELRKTNVISESFKFTLTKYMDQALEELYKEAYNNGYKEGIKDKRSKNK